MAGFEQYHELKKKQQELFRGDEEKQEQWQPIDLFHQDYEDEMQRELYEKQQKKGLGENIEDGGFTASYIEEKQRLQMSNTTFAERTEYYFKDPRYLEAKEERYRSLAEDGAGEVEAFSKKHKNRSAKKRKKKANAAADSFAKARELEKKHEAGGGDSNLSRKDIFMSRSEIMRARMEGMINAAKVKATSKTDEKYRIAKAKLSCLSKLYEQAEQIRDRESEYFDRVQSDLQKEIDSTKASLKKYAMDPTAKWKEALGCNDEESLKQELKETGNPYATIEDVKLARMYSGMGSEYKRPEYVEAEKIANEHKAFGDIGTRRDELTAPTYLIRRDKQGNPISKEEMEKEKWNKRWLEAVKDPEQKYERKKMILESFQRFKQLEFPSPEEVRKKGWAGLMKENPVRMYEIWQYSLRLDNIRRNDPIITEYMQYDKVFRTKMDVARHIPLIMANVLNREFNLVEGTGLNIKKGDNYYGLEDEDHSEKARLRRRKEFWEPVKENEEELFEKYVKDFPTIAEAEQEEKQAIEGYREKRVMTFEEAKADAKLHKAPVFSEEGYQVYLDFKKTNQQMDCPMYLLAYKATQEKLGSGKDITRVCGAMMRPVHFNDKWQPISNEDMAAHEWNMRYLANLHTLYNGPILEGQERDALAEAEKKLADGKYTEERFKETNIVKSIEAKKENAEKELKKMAEEELIKTFSGGYEELPSPELLKKELLEPALKGEFPDSPMMEQIRNNMDGFVLMLQKCLSLEETTKREFAKDLKEKYGAMFDSFQMAYNFFGNIAEYYFSKKWGVKPKTGGNASFGGAALRDAAALSSFMELYEMQYNSFIENKAKAGL